MVSNRKTGEAANVLTADMVAIDLGSQIRIRSSSAFKEKATSGTGEEDGAILQNCSVHQVDYIVSLLGGAGCAHVDKSIAQPRKKEITHKARTKPPPNVGMKRKDFTQDAGARQSGNETGNSRTMPKRRVDNIVSQCFPITCGQKKMSFPIIPDQICIYEDIYTRLVHAHLCSVLFPRRYLAHRRRRGELESRL